MDFVAQLTFRANTTGEERDAAMMRRAGWAYPDNISLITECWPFSGAPHVISIFSTDDPGALLELEMEWNDVFDVVIAPAVSAEDGLALGAEVMGRITRLQPV